MQHTASGAIQHNPADRIRASLLTAILPGDPLGGLESHITDVEADIAERDGAEYRRDRDMLLGYLNCLVALDAVDYGDRTELIDELDERWKEAKECTGNT